MVRINGKNYDVAGKKLSDVLVEFGYQKEMIAVERNEEIVPKATYEEVVLQEDDEIEVVSFVGGG